MRTFDLSVSHRTLAVVIGGLLVLLTLAVAAVSIEHTQPVAGDATSLTLLTDVASVGFGVLASAMVALAAFKYRVDNPLRRIWALIAIGLALYTIGDAIWLALDVRSSFTEVPYPSLADLFYVLAPLFIAYGLARTTLAFARSASARRPLVMGLALTLIAAAGAFMLVSLPVVRDATQSLIVRALAVYYPISDIVLLFGQSVFVLLAARIVTQMKAIRHWEVLCAGLLVWAVADIHFIWADQTGGYFAGHPADFGWMLSLLLLGLAGSLTADRLETCSAPA